MDLITEPAAATTVRLLQAGPVWLLALAGVLTSATLLATRRKLVMHWADGAPPQALVLDTRRLVLGMDAAKMTERLLADPVLREIPLAYVSEGPNAEVFRDHAFLCARQGVLRVVLSQPGPALAWAQDQVRLMQCRSRQTVP